MTAKQKQTRAEQLEQMRSALVKHLSEQRVRAASTPLSRPGDPVDEAMREISMGTQFMLMELEQRRIQRIAAARRRLLDGRFGTCEQCGARIRKRRLQVLPQTSLCVECARYAEREHVLH